jgi:hypothetical protein
MRVGFEPLPITPSTSGENTMFAWLLVGLKNRAAIFLQHQWACQGGDGEFARGRKANCAELYNSRVLAQFGFQ